MKDRRHKQSRPVGAMTPRATKSAKPLRCGWCGRTVNNQAAMLNDKRICKRCIRLARKEQGGTINGTGQGTSNSDQASSAGEDSTVCAGHTISSTRDAADAGVQSGAGAGEGAGKGEAS